MEKKFLWISIIAVFVSFFGGFLLANALNKTEINNIRAENDRLKSAQDNTEKGLSDEEIREKIAQADGNPSDVKFQKNLGMALYRYAALKQNTDMLAEVSRLLERAYANDSKDYDVLVTLGNVYFDIGYFKKDNEKLIKARDFYAKALEIKPNEVEVRTDLGLTYSLVNPPEPEKALAEYRKSLQLNPKHEKTLQFTIQALILLNENSEAENYLSKLKQINPDNQMLPELSAQLAAK